MKLNAEQAEELTKLIKKAKMDLPVHRREIKMHDGTYTWLQKNISERNADKLTPRIKELLDIK